MIIFRRVPILIYVYRSAFGYAYECLDLILKCVNQCVSIEMKVMMDKMVRFASQIITTGHTPLDYNFIIIIFVQIAINYMVWIHWLHRQYSYIIRSNKQSARPFCNQDACHYNNYNIRL